MNKPLNAKEWRNRFAWRALQQAVDQARIADCVVTAETDADALKIERAYDELMSVALQLIRSSTVKGSDRHGIQAAISMGWTASVGLGYFARVN